MAAIYNETGNLLAGSAVAATPVVLPVNPEAPRVRVTVDPAGTVDVDYTVSSLEDIENSNAVWFAGGITGASAIASESLDGPISGVRISATTSDAGYEVRF